MSDPDEINWREMNLERRRRMQFYGRQNLERAKNKDDGHWKKHTEFYWSRDLCGHRLEYWPTTRRFKYMGQLHKGNIEKFMANPPVISLVAEGSGEGQ